MNKRTVKVKPSLVKANLIVSQGDGWRVEFDRASRDYLAMINSVGCIGITETPSAAQTLCQEYTVRQLSAAAT
ncbi:MAG: hypothetical protein IPP13_21790 [Kouleothrix sp.]|jgi:hypothetical protein|nr:hypothetical protein [Kouleothrix sp.]